MTEVYATSSQPWMDPFDIEYASVFMFGIASSEVSDDVLRFISEQGRMVTDLHMEDAPKLIEFLKNAYAQWKAMQDG